MQIKRKVRSMKKPYPVRARSAAKRGRTGYANIMRASTLSNRVQRIERTIETKESTFTLANQQIQHNNVLLWNQNPFSMVNGSNDPMAGIGSRIGDRVTVKGVAATFFVEGSLNRSKVHFRIMLMKAPRGATFSRADIFKGLSGNKMIDQLNTERYTIIAQKRFDVRATNDVASNLSIVSGVPTGTPTPGMTGNKIIKFWIPGRKFGKYGQLQYENASSDVKFYDYRWVLCAYDWYGTPQDSNIVGFLNEAWCKIYFKDA